MNLIIIHGEVYKLNKKDFKRTIEVQEMDKIINEYPDYQQILIEHHEYIKSKYKVIQINPPTLMY